MFQSKPHTLQEVGVRNRPGIPRSLRHASSPDKSKRSRTKTPERLCYGGNPPVPTLLLQAGHGFMYPAGTVQARDIVALNSAVPGMGRAHGMVGSAQCPPQPLPPAEPSPAHATGSTASQRPSGPCPFVGTTCQGRIWLGAEVNE